MKLLIRLVFAAALLGACLATPASAQYMYLDSNGDGVNTAADVMAASGTPTTVDVWLNTNTNRAGEPEVCNTEEAPLDLGGYVIILQASGGTVTYGDFTNQAPFSAIAANYGPLTSPDGSSFMRGVGGPAGQNLQPGLYKIATFIVTAATGAPSLNIIDNFSETSEVTNFGTSCDGNDFDSTYKLSGTSGIGTDWEDVDGLGPGAGGNAFPLLDIPTEVVGGVGTPLLITATATDPDASDVLTITFSTTASFLTNFTHTPSVSPATATLGGTPPDLTQGQYDVMWAVSDGHNEPVTGTTLVNITEGGGPNDCPVLTPIGNLTANELELLTFVTTATDADPGQSVEFSLGAGAPDGANINSQTGLFTWTPSEEQGPGTYDITFRTTDNASPACTDSEVVQVTVNEVDGQNQCPVLTPIGDKTVNEGIMLTFTAAATDPDAGQTLTFSLGEGAPTGATLDSNSGLFNWTPTEEQGPGAFPITVRVFDTGQPACADSETINVTVNEVGEGNQCPVLTLIGNQTVTEGTLLTFTAAATDPDVGQTLTFTLDPGFPTGAAIDAGSGVFTFTPTPDQGPGKYPVTVRVTDNADPACSDFESLMITVNDTGGNQCPVLDAIGNQAVNEGTLLTLDANATDPDAGQTLTFSLDAGFPTGAAIDPSTGVFTWTPTPDQGPGKFTITIRVTDSADPACSDFEAITVTVNEIGGNQCPVLDAIGDKTVTEGQLLTFTATATDADAGQTLTFSLINLIPAGAAIDPATGVFTWTPTSKQGPGASDVTIQVADNATTPCLDSEIIHVTVLDAGGENQCPVLAPIGDKTVTEGQLLTFAATATDADAGQTLTFSLINLIPDGAAIDPVTGVFTWTPAQGPAASDVTIQVADNATTPCLDSEIIHVTVLDAGGENQCPVLAPIGDKTVTEGQLLTFTATATDADAGQTLTFSLINLIPAGAAIDPVTGVFTWTPTPDQGLGAYDVTIQVADNATTPCLDSEIIHVTVLDAGGNQCPLIQPIAGQTVTEGETVSFTVMATDPENTTLVYSLIGAPPGAQIHPLTGLFTWTPTDAQGGTHTITVQVRNTCEDPCSVTATVTIVVKELQPPNQCPVLTPIGNRTVEEEDLLTFTAMATDPDVGQTLTFSLDPGFPTGAAIDPSTGVFTFTPTHDQTGTHSITIRVTDNGDPACSDFETIVVTVEEGVNECPVLAPIGNKTVTEGENLTFTVTATDEENDEIIFSLDAGSPAGAVINANTGVFTWTPTSEQGPGTFDITIRATDLCDSPCSDTETIQVTVLDVGGANECPVLATIGDKTVTEGDLLTFTAMATDAENDEIVFTLENSVPAGAAIDANTGVFTWTPSSSQGPGAYDVTIQATDLCTTPCSDSEIIHVTVLDAGGGGGSGETPTVSAYFVGGKTTRLWTGKQEICVQLEVSGSAQIDYSSVELVYNGQRIAPREAQRSRDRDRDGNREATVCFSKQDLRGLFAGLPSGENMVTIQIMGRFQDGESFTANVTHRIAVRGGHTGNGNDKAHAAPNPLNPSTVLWFGTTREGSVKIDVFDLAGRLVRTLYEGSMPAGSNSVSWDGTGSSGGRVSSGVYYFRVASVDGQDVVRVTVLK